MTTFKNRQLTFNSPQGYLINGKISPTVASNNLTVALKTLAGTDPSASDPVYVRIADTVKTITAALSVTLNAGRNCFNAGSAELATKEIDYFVYLNHCVANGAVRIAFTRLPFAQDITPFTNWADAGTGEKDLAINDHTGYASTDPMECIGRFAATLSAGAGYTWSVPTFTAVNLIQRPIYETRWLTCVPIITGGTAPTYTAQFINRYKISDNIARVTYSWSNTSGGTAGSGANIITTTLPFGISATASGTSNSRYVLGSGFSYESGGTAANVVANIYNTTANQFYMMSSAMATIVANDQSSADRSVSLQMQYEI